MESDLFFLVILRHLDKHTHTRASKGDAHLRQTVPPPKQPANPIKGWMASLSFTSGIVLMHLGSFPQNGRLAIANYPKSQIRLSSGKVGTGWWVPEAPDGLRANIPQDSGPEFAQ